MKNKKYLWNCSGVGFAESISCMLISILASCFDNAREIFQKNIAKHVKNRM